MIDIGITIKLSESDAPTVPVTKWANLENCTAMPALLQPSSKIATDFIGDKYTGELLGKQSVTGLDFTFAYDDGAKEGAQFKHLNEVAAAGKAKWLSITYPDGTNFELAVKIEVSLVAPTPSGIIEYVMSAVPVKHGIEARDLIAIVWPGETSNLG